VAVSERASELVGPGPRSAIARDVTEQRRAERMLRESESKLRGLFESDVAGILFGDIHGNILDANDKLLALSGYTRADLDAGLSWLDPTPPEFLALDEADASERELLVAELAPDRILSQGEARFRHKPGEIRHAMVSMEAVTLSGIPDPLNMVMLVDLTERRQLEAQTARSARTSP
jgi:PAS domain S-box-containing protein